MTTRKAGSPDLIMSVNFSARQILNSDLVETVRAILAAAVFGPRKLWLETCLVW